MAAMVARATRPRPAPRVHGGVILQDRVRRHGQSRAQPRRYSSFDDGAPAAADEDSSMVAAMNEHVRPICS